MEYEVIRLSQLSHAYNECGMVVAKRLLFIPHSKPVFIPSLKVHHLVCQPCLGHQLFEIFEWRKENVIVAGE